MNEEYIKTYIKDFNYNVTKNVTSTILAHELSQHTTQIDQDMSELPVEITKKLSATTLESPTWHTDIQKGNTSLPTITPIEEYYRFSIGNQQNSR